MEKLTLEQIKNKLPEFTEEEREFYLDAFWKISTNGTKAGISDFENKWFEEHDQEKEGEEFDHEYAEFVKEQNRLFIEYMKMEVSAIGYMVRVMHKLPQLDWQTLLPLPEALYNPEVN